MNSMPASVCAVVVTFNPGVRTVDSLRALTAQAPVVVVDNTPGESSAEVLNIIELMDSVQLIRNRQNLGIAAALNRGIRKAIECGYQWVATFDQDSTVTPGFFASLLAAYQRYPAKEQVALVAPKHVYPDSKETDVANADNLPEWSLIRTAMTSGSLIRTEIFSKVGCYDEGMFIDYVDYEYCFRLQRAGFQLLRANRVLLFHQLGVAKTWQVLGRSFSVKVHSPWRRYYITRNRLITYRRHGLRFPRWMLHDFGWFFLELAKILLFEDQKAVKLRNIALGLWHGIRGRTGVLIEPKA
jgi:rhamnosyltransferase